ncbi:hypothetical protein HPB47_018912 [Ixodes persulcatus]|uniref:Uncharacterized protein n=1 Tax=Ixodes persulcatus TaxID=34615 RepID=A0AC60QKE6_IXOPE|nr:hypothetical protein HPB47_018912 [Ixodes persulcatus]
MGVRATTVARDQWGQICDQMQGTLGMKKTWQLLRHLLDPDQKKAKQKHRMTKILQTYLGSNDELVAQTRDTKTDSPKPKNRTARSISGRDNHSSTYPRTHYSQTTAQQHAPMHHTDRREQRTRALHKKYKNDPRMGVFPNPTTMTHIHLSLYPTSVYPLCGAHTNLAHIIWACPQVPFPEIPSEEGWEASLRSPDPDLQAHLVKRAEEVAGRPRPMATTGPPT